MEQPSAPASNPKVFSVAESRVDVAANLVERGDEIIHLEPRVMQLLVCLAERAGRVVSRGELEAEVWSGMVVGYDALTQAISKLRKALDDDPHHPRLVETVAKSGYRLMVAVQPGSSTRAVQAVEPAFDIPNTAVSTTLSSPASPRTTRAKLQRIVLMLLLPGFVIWLFLRPNPQPPVDATQPSLAVLPFSNLSGDAGWDYLSAGISEDLITTLAGHEGLVVIRQPVFNSQDETRDPASIARSLGARYLVEGSIQGDPQRLQLNVRLTDTQTNRHLWAKRYERDVDGLFAVLDHLTQAIIAVLLPSQPPEEAAVAPERPAGSGNELSYDSLIDSPRRLKCLYGHVAQMAGDHIAAVRIFQDCIDRWNDVNSMIGLAQIYETGIGVPRDLTAATLLMRRGAQIQDPVGYSSLARYHYGMALVEGKGVAPDTVAGLRWLRRAAAEGIEEASAYIAEHFPAESPVAGQR